MESSTSTRHCRCAYNHGKRAFITGLSIIAFAGLLLFSFYFLYNSPSVGVTVSWDEAQGRYKVLSSQSWSSIEKGDVIKRIGKLEIGFHHLLTDNIYIYSRGELLSWFEAKKDVFQELEQSQVVVSVEREGRDLDLSIAPKKASLSFLNHLEILHFLVGIVFFLTGTITFYKSGPGEQGITFHLMCLTLTLVFITNATSLMSEIVYNPAYLRLINMINIIALPLGNAILLHFSLLIPRKRDFLVRFPFLPYLFYGFNIVTAASLQIPILNFCTALYALLTIISVTYAFFAHRQPLERQQMKWVAAGFVFGVAPWALINAIPMLLTGQRLMTDTIPATFTVSIPLFMAFAIRKYRLLDIDAFFEGTFCYVITLLLLGTADLSFMGLLSTHIGNEPAINPAGKAFLSLLLVVSIYAGVRDRVKALVRRLFKKDALDEAAILDSFRDNASGQSSEAILDILSKTIGETFRPKQLILITAKSPGTVDVLKAFQGLTGPVNLWERPLSEALPYRDVYVALPVGKGDEVQAVILLGAFPEGGFYTRRHIVILAGLLGLAEILLQNAGLHEANIRQSRISLEKERMYSREKEKMLKDLHDGVGGIVTNVNLLAEMALSSPALHDARRALSAISELSREGLSEIRSFMKSLDNKDANWHTLAVDFRLFGKNVVESHGMSFDIETNISNTEDQPGSLLCLSLFRIYKEALTNIIKHSQADTVKAAFDVSPERLFLSVQDNGIGLRQGMKKCRGISNMRARAEEVGGTLSLTSDKGVCVSLEVPLPVKYPVGGMELEK
jgi:signal transduction histidine kinase